MPMNDRDIMAGPHGEVMVMNWGIAKHISRSKGSTTQGEEERDDMALPASSTLGDDGQPSTTPSIDRMYATQGQSIVGTPLYMSPEQAMGAADRLDERTDVYSLCAALYELLALTSYLQPKKTMKELLVAVITEEPKLAFMTRHPHQPRVPAQYSNFLIKGLAKDPADRYQSVAEMRQNLQKVTEGYFGVMCPISLIKRPVHGLLHLIDRFPMISLALLVVLVTSMAGGLILTLTR